MIRRVLTQLKRLSKLRFKHPESAAHSALPLASESINNISHPYMDIEDHRMWRRALVNVPYEQVDPVIKPLFKLSKQDKISTAGSCFAQHISRYLSQNGFKYHVTEKAHPIMDERAAKRCNYGVFPARFGNIYTAAQLKQLYQRAYGANEYDEAPWSGADGAIVDPFRPMIQPGGFYSIEEYEQDQIKHLQATKQMFETMDVFVWTLGLTEHWRSKTTGAVYPVCPGVSAGQFDANEHEFHNATVEETVNDTLEVFRQIREKNKNCKFIVSVSPVPLIATAMDRHVLSSTTYSKSVLRVAAEQICNGISNCAYFPSYEVITGAYNRGQYFAEDLREVRHSGVAHAMQLFAKHYLGQKHASGDETRNVAITAANAEAKKPASHQLDSPDNLEQELAEADRVICEEEILDDKR